MLVDGKPALLGRPDGHLVVLPFVYGMLNNTTLLWASDEAHYVHTIELDAYNPYAYGQMLQSLWNRHGDLIVVEQDVVPDKRAVTQFLECGELWCACPYHVSGKVYGRVLGCTKYSAKLQAEHPNLMWQAASNLGGTLRLAHWRQLNEAIIRQLDIRHIALHEHDIPAAHLHDYEAFPDA